MMLGALCLVSTVQATDGLNTIILQGTVQFFRARSALQDPDERKTAVNFEVVVNNPDIKSLSGIPFCEAVDKAFLKLWTSDASEYGLPPMTPARHLAEELRTIRIVYELEGDAYLRALRASSKSSVKTRKYSI
jgi:hypothetical protein